jgi:hypothetical protein
MSDIWGPIPPNEWRSTPYLAGRVAIDADVREGRAVFFVNGDSEPAVIQLPCCALQKRDDGSCTRVVVVQAEHVDGQTLLGVRSLTGGNGICLLSDVEILQEGFDASTPNDKSLEGTREG